MAIKPSKHKKKLTTEQVLDIRNNYFLGMERIEDLAFRFNVSERTMHDAIHGKGYYKDIPDDLEWWQKENRVQWRSFTATDKTKKARDKREGERFKKQVWEWQKEQVFGKGE